MYNVALCKITDPTTYISVQDKLVIPAVESVPVPDDMANKRAKATIAFALACYVLSYIRSYRFIMLQKIRVPFGHQNVKYPIVLSAVICKRPAFARAFTV